MSRPRSALATRLPPGCSICLAPEITEPAWRGADEVVCARCCDATLSLIRRADAGLIADIWFLGGAALQSTWDGRGSEPHEARTLGDLALAYAEMGLDRDALLEALVATRRGGRRVWECVAGIILGSHVDNPAFRAGLRAALPAIPPD